MNNPFYIKEYYSIHPLMSFEALFTTPALAAIAGDQRTVIEPEYDSMIDPRLIRRMSKVLKMGVAAGLEALNRAGIANPDAIIAGTAYGCLGDTAVFLEKMAAQDESLLPPTPFIQSTHNTVSGQIALSLKCRGYNMTYTQRGHSFENALMDAMTFESPGQVILLGAFDELTPELMEILRRTGFFRHSEIKGGEGAAFFVGSLTPDDASRYKVSMLKTSFTGITDELLTAVRAAEPDIVLSGQYGSDKSGFYGQMAGTYPKETLVLPYKDICGEYPTSTAFALALACELIARDAIPAYLQTKSRGDISKVLIVNNYTDLYYSALLIEKM